MSSSVGEKTTFRCCRFKDPIPFFINLNPTNPIKLTRVVFFNETLFFTFVFYVMRLTVCIWTFCGCWDSNSGPLVSEATVLPTAPQPRPNWKNCLELNSITGSGCSWRVENAPHDLEVVILKSDRVHVTFLFCPFYAYLSLLLLQASHLVIILAISRCAGTFLSVGSKVFPTTYTLREKIFYYAIMPR